MSSHRLLLEFGFVRRQYPHLLAFSLSNQQYLLSLDSSLRVQAVLLLGFQSCQSTSSFMVCAFPSSVRVRDLPTSILWSPEPPFLVWVLQATARGPSRGPPWVGLGIQEITLASSFISCFTCLYLTIVLSCACFVLLPGRAVNNSDQAGSFIGCPMLSSL